MTNTRTVYPGAISNEDASRYYRSRNDTYNDNTLTNELRDVVESSIEDGKFVMVSVRHVTNWETGDYYHPFITDILYVEDTFTKRMFNDAYTSGPDTDDSMDYTVFIILHKDKAALDKGWDDNIVLKKEEEKVPCDEFGYPY